MKDGPDIASIAALIGDPARANMLTALLSGKALTASELANEAGVTVQTASSHIARLREGGLLQEQRQGRHKYLSLAGENVAAALEALMGLAARTGQMRTRPGPKDEALRKARVCYNHLAGAMGTQLLDAMLADGRIHAEGENLLLTASGHLFAETFGIDMTSLRNSRAPLCRQCLDWSERRPHLAGSLGRALLTRMEALKWAKREDGSRVVRFTKTGEMGFEGAFGSAAPAD